MKLTADNEAINYLKDYFNKDFIEITVDGEKKIFVSEEKLKEKDKIIDLLIKELYTKAHISTRCYLQTSTEECMKYKNCYECIKKYFEKKAKG